MSGLTPTTETILSLTCLLTSSDLHLLDPPGFTTTIYHPPSVLTTMSPWCLHTHTTTGLTSLCAASTTTPLAAATALLSYIRTHIPTPGIALLAGNSIHADRAFLSREPWDRVLAHLHYRVLDVSSIKEAVRRWAPERVLRAVPVKLLRHESRADVEESLEEARYYMRVLRGLGGDVEDGEGEVEDGVMRDSGGVA